MASGISPCGPRDPTSARVNTGWQLIRQVAKKHEFIHSLLPADQILESRFSAGLTTVAKEAVQFFPPDYVARLSVREWLRRLPLEEGQYANGDTIVAVLDSHLKTFTNRMGIEGAACKRHYKLRASSALHLVTISVPTIAPYWGAGGRQTFPNSLAFPNSLVFS